MAPGDRSSKLAEACEAVTNMKKLPTFRLQPGQAPARLLLLGWLGSRSGRDLSQNCKASAPHLMAPGRKCLRKGGSLHSWRTARPPCCLKGKRLVTQEAKLCAIKKVSVSVGLTIGSDDLLVVHSLTRRSGCSFSCPGCGHHSQGFHECAAARVAVMARR